MRGSALTVEEREGISRGIAEGFSGPWIEIRLGRNWSVIYREITRCGGRDKYRAAQAQERAEAQAARPKPRKLLVNTRLHGAVNEGLGEKWSPEQISHHLKIDYSGILLGIGGPGENGSTVSAASRSLGMKNHSDPAGSR